MEDNAEKAISVIIILILLVMSISIGGTLTDLFLETPIVRLPIQQFYWTSRWLDIFVQAFLIFAATAAVASLFREEKVVEVEEEAPVEE